MNTQFVTIQPAAGPRRPTRPTRRVHARAAAGAMVLRAATVDDAAAIFRLIDAHREEGHLLARSLGELAIRAPRFVVAVQGAAGRRRGERIVGCAELAPLSDSIAEVRSLVVDGSARSRGIGRRLLDELRRTARRDGFRMLCAFTHDATYFVRKGYSIVPHEWVPEKIARDCSSCALFRQCGQHAVVLSLGA